jgi:DNA (cytosine-5)-methyltransferase 1
MTSRYKRSRHTSGLFDELLIDNFAGGGGASLGMEMGLGRQVDIAINHDRDAVAMHSANHPATLHLCEDVFAVDPAEVTRGRPIGIAWFSPDCKHFSRAKGSKPVSKKIRGLAWVVIRWAKLPNKPRIIMLENVREFADWGPVVKKYDQDGNVVLGADGRPQYVPCPRRKGVTFKRWVGELRRLGYAVEWRNLNAADFGAPTHRRRLFLIARCDGLPIVWPEPTHGPGRLPYRTAAECIDWSIPCPSIFLTPEEGRAIGVKRPLAYNTLRRVFMGLRRYVLENPRPFIVKCNHGGTEFRGQPVDRPLATITGKHDYAVATPCVMRNNHGEKPADALDEPLRTITGQGNKFSLIAPFLTAQYGERPGQEPRSHAADGPLPTITPRDGGGFPLVAPSLVRICQNGGNGDYANAVEEPLGTIVSKNEHCLVAAHLSKFFGGVVGQEVTEPAPTITAIDHTALVAASLVQYNTEKSAGETRGQAVNQPINTITPDPRFALSAAYITRLNHGQKSCDSADEPLRTVVAQGNHHAVTVAALEGPSNRREKVLAFLSKYFGNAVGQVVEEPLHTITAKDRFGLVQVRRVLYAIVDIGLRMLTPRELYRAQGFPDSYVIDPVITGRRSRKTGRRLKDRRLPKDAQTRMCGNSVSPVIPRALVEANYSAAKVFEPLGVAS